MKEPAKDRTLGAAFASDPEGDDVHLCTQAAASVGGLFLFNYERKVAYWYKCEVLRCLLYRRY